MLKVMMLCSGLSHVRRGFESFTRECFDALAGRPELDMRLLKGSGPAGERERALPCLRRSGRLAALLGAAGGRDAYFVEQATFAFGALPAIRSFRPQVIYFSDGAVGNALWRLRRAAACDFKLLLSNGAPFTPPYVRWDHVQELTPGSYEAALEKGEPESKLSLLPYGFAFEESYEPPGGDARRSLRARLGLPAERRIALSVAALNRAHKRLDYLIDELAAIEASRRPFLLALGEADPGSRELVGYARTRLGERGFAVRSVAAEEMAEYYKACDWLVSCSLKEGFGRALVEAGGYGLPCVAHDNGINRFLFGSGAKLIDMQAEGALARALGAEDMRTSDPGELCRDLRARFSWQSLARRYVEMFYRGASVPCPA